MSGDEAHTFFPVTSYVCTLLHMCFENIESAEELNLQNSVMSTDHSKVNLITAEHLTLTTVSLSYIQNLLDNAHP